VGTCVATNRAGATWHTERHHVEAGHLLATGTLGRPAERWERTTVALLTSALFDLPAE
jgi:hypothetical protein